MTIDVSTFCTNDDLLDELGSRQELDRLLRAEDATSVDPTLRIREAAYRDVIKSLARRTPPVFESSLSNLDELRDAVVYGTLARLYREAMTNENDVFGSKWKHWQKMFQTEVTHLRVTVASSASVDTLSISLDRR